MKHRGFVDLVGAGPGAADLLTVRALRLIERAEMIVHDRLVSDEVLDLAPAAAVRINVGKSRGRHCMAQEAINALLVELACAGHQVVRLKGGDPFVFGRGGEEVEALAAASIGFDVVPGVPATLADLPAATRAANESGPGLLLVGAVVSRMRQPGRLTTGEVRARDVTATTSA